MISKQDVGDQIYIKSSKIKLVLIIFDVSCFFINSPIAGLFFKV